MIDKDQPQTKVNKFIRNNNILSLNKDPTEKYEKLIHAIKKANSIIEKMSINTSSISNLQPQNLQYSLKHTK